MSFYYPKPIQQAYENDPRLALARQQQQAGMDYSPVGHWTQALARALGGITGTVRQKNIESDYKKQSADYQQALGSILSSPDPRRALQSSSNPYLKELGQDQALTAALNPSPTFKVLRGEDVGGTPGALYQQSSDGQLRLISQPQASGNKYRVVGKNLIDISGETPTVVYQDTTGGSGMSNDEINALALRGGAKASNGIEVSPEETTAMAMRGLTPEGKKPLTEQQAKNTAFSKRAANADLTLSDPKSRDALLNYGDFLQEQLPLGVGNLLVSDEYRLADQAATEFVISIIRPDTGAAVQANEWEYARKNWIPQPGDDPATLAAKAHSRRVAIEGVRAGLSKEEIMGKEPVAPDIGTADLEQGIGELIYNPDTGDFE